MKIGNREFDFKNSAYVCGILNVTPDSFSDGGKYNTLDAALYHTEEMIRSGAALIDLGGESTRPGYTMISDEEEIGRVVPVLQAIKERFDIPVSLDTYKAAVAQAGIEAGADLLNDIWGLHFDEKDDIKETMAQVIARSKLPCCLMHNRREPDYQDFLKDYIQDNAAILDKAKRYGIPKDRIILDPGVGFGKTYEQNLTVINTLDQLCGLGCPVLLGTSRKSVVGLTLDLPKDERMEGTVATNVIGLMKGAAIFRVHDVKENYRALKMAAAVMGMEFDK